jgi:hypothetical protein
MKWQFWKKQPKEPLEPESGSWPSKASKLLNSQDLKKTAGMAKLALELKDAEKTKEDFNDLIKVINYQAILGRTQTKIIILDKDYDPNLKHGIIKPTEIKGTFSYSEFGLDAAQKYFTSSLKPLGYQVLLRNINWNIQGIHGTHKETFVGYELIIAW